MAIYKIQMRRDTSINWTTNNPILNVGEFGYAIDTDELKIGNGTDNWNTIQIYGNYYNSGNGIDIVNDNISLDISDYTSIKNTKINLINDKLFEINSIDNQNSYISLFNCKTNVEYMQFFLDGYNIIMKGYDFNDNYSFVEVDKNVATIGGFNNNDYVRLIFDHTNNTTPMLVDDTTYKIGLQYNDDYSANYTDRSLIDNGF